MGEILTSVVDALEDAEHPAEEVMDMMSQLSCVFGNYLSKCKEFLAHRIDIISTLNNLKTMLNISWRMDVFKYDFYSKIDHIDNFFPLVDSINEQLRLHHLPLTDVHTLKLIISSTVCPEEALQTNFNQILKTSDNFSNIIQARISTVLEGVRAKREL